MRLFLIKIFFSKRGFMHCSRCDTDHPGVEHCPTCPREEDPGLATAREAPGSEAVGATAGDAREPLQAGREGDDNRRDGGEKPIAAAAATPSAPVSTDTDAQGGEGKRSETGRAAQTRVKKSKLRNFNSAPHSENVYFTEQVSNIFGGTEKDAPPPPRSLLELTTALPSLDPGAAELAPGEVAARHREMMAERLLLVSCVDAGVAKAAAHAVVDGLGAAPGEARLLNFDRLSGDEAPQTIYSLVLPPGERLSDVVVVVDAASHRARAFLDHLLDPRNGLWSASSLRGHLKDAGLLVICLVPRERFAGGARVETPFPHWAVPFLEPLLAAAFPGEHRDLRAAILRQREAGRWSRNEDVFCGQVRTALSSGTLNDVVAAGGPSPESEVVLGEERPVHNAVLYAAAFFPRLNPADFGRVVTVLLQDDAAPASSARPAAPSAEAVPSSEAHAAGRAPARKKLAEVWRESGDGILRECRLTVIRDPEGGRLVSFADPGTGDQLRERLEDEYAFSLHHWFAALHRAGLLFDRSDPVATALVRLTARMAAEYPESYGRDWVMDQLAPARATSPDRPRMLKRSVELLRGLCEHTVLQPVVAGVMEGLLQGREFAVALALVRRLRFAPGFDEFHWMRQLIDRGPRAIADETAQFLLDQLLAAGPQVHPILRALWSWVPAEDRPAGSYSPSNRAALQLLVGYAVESLDRMKTEEYGAWPSRYPLLAFPHAEAAARDLSLVVGWLLHPGVPAVFAEEMEEGEGPGAGENAAEALGRTVMQRLVAALLAEWVFILYGPSGTPADPSSAPGKAVAGAAGFGPDALLDAVARELVARTADRRGREVRRAMLRYWEDFKEELARIISERGEGKPELRAEFVWKRRLLRVLPLRIRSHSSAAAFAAAPAAV